MNSEQAIKATLKQVYEDGRVLFNLDIPHANIHGLRIFKNIYDARSQIEYCFKHNRQLSHKIGDLIMDLYHTYMTEHLRKIREGVIKLKGASIFSY